MHTSGNVMNPITIMIIAPKMVNVRIKVPKPLSIGTACLYSNAKYREATTWIKNKKVCLRVNIRFNSIRIGNTI
jgi:hypothetical protein